MPDALGRNKIFIDRALMDMKYRMEPVERMFKFYVDSVGLPLLLHR